MLDVIRNDKLIDRSSQEHSPLNATLLVSLIRTIQYHSNGSMVPFVRIPSYAPELFNFALSAGAGGVVMPRIQNAKQAEDLIRLARFPPMGDRGFPPAALINEQQNRTPQGQTTYDVWNSHAAVICQIEDLQGLENIEEICRVPGGEYPPSLLALDPWIEPTPFVGRYNSKHAYADTSRVFAVDGLFVGTGDLRLCMNLTPGSLDGEEPVFVAALQKIQDTAKAYKLPIMGFGLSPSTLQRRIKMGWTAFIIHGDVDAILSSATQTLKFYGDAAYESDRHLSA